MQRPFFNKLSIKAKESWYYPICSFNFCWGSVGDALWNARPKMRRYLQHVNCHSIRALCAPSVLSCGSCRIVVDSGHLHSVISSFPEIFVDGPVARSMLVSHPAMGRNKPVCLAPCASFRCIVEWARKLHSSRGVKKARKRCMHGSAWGNKPSWDGSNRAANVRNLVFTRRTQG